MTHTHTFLRKEREPKAHHRRVQTNEFKAKVAYEVALILDTELDIELLAKDLRCEIAQFWDVLPMSLKVTKG